jgi:predicted naringenin-chalcone synthase
MTTAHINRIGTAVPPHDVHEAFVVFARTLLEDDRTRFVFDRMAERAGMAHRYSFLRPGEPGAIDVDADGFYRRGAFPGTGARMARYETDAVKLAVQAIACLGIEGEGITNLIVASCTGFTAPGLDQLIAERLGLGGSLERTLVGFMGCYAAVPALRNAHHIVRSNPAARVLVVNLELCSLHMQETPDLERVLSFLLFGDGATAALVTAEAQGIALHDFHAATIPNTQDLITWRIGDQGFDMHLSGKVPARIATALRAEADRNDTGGILRGQNLADVVHWAVHAGGRTVLDAVEAGLRLSPHALHHCRAVLRDVGNISSATLMFVLARILAQDVVGPGVGMAFGPGLSAETFRFSRL